MAVGLCYQTNQKPLIMSTQTANPPATASVISPEELLNHWQGHRGLTRKTIEAFPEDKLFTYSIGGMRPFSELVYEFLGMAVPGLNGIVTGKWAQWADAEKVNTKKELLEIWDKATEQINKL